MTQDSVNVLFMHFVLRSATRICYDELHGTLLKKSIQRMKRVQNLFTRINWQQEPKKIIDLDKMNAFDRFRMSPFFLSMLNAAKSVGIKVEEFGLSQSYWADAALFIHTGKLFPSGQLEPTADELIIALLRCAKKYEITETVINDCNSIIKMTKGLCGPGNSSITRGIIM